MVNNLGFNSACGTMNSNIHKDHDQSNKKLVLINKVRILLQFVLFVFCGAAAQRGPWPPHS
jgi:hypothetical protein